MNSPATTNPHAFSSIQPIKTQMTTTNPPITRFLSAGGFHYDLTCEPIAALTNHFNLRITTQWDGARKSEDHQVVLNLTLQRTELDSLVTALRRQLDAAVTGRDTTELNA